MKITVTDAVEGYQEHAQSLGLSPEYIRTTMLYLKRFAKSCDQAARESGYRGPLKAERLTPQHVSRFFQTLPSTRASHNRALSALRAFMDYLERMKYLDPGDGKWLLGDRKTKVFTRQPKYYIPVSQFQPMIEAAQERHYADRITLALAFYTLARQGEIASIQLRDLDLEAGMIRIHRFKRKRWTDVTICPELMAELDIWLGVYAEETDYGCADWMIRDHPDWFLAPKVIAVKGRAPGGHFDASLTTWRIEPESQAEGLEYLVKRMLDIFGAQTEDGRRVRHKGEGMHTIRRSGARAMIDHLASVYGEDKALLMVSTMLDHEDTKMTLTYIGRNIEQKRLNEWLKGNSMYGPAPTAPGSNVVRMPLGASRSPVEPRSSSSSISGRVGEIDAL